MTSLDTKDAEIADVETEDRAEQLVPGEADRLIARRVERSAGLSPNGHINFSCHVAAASIEWYSGLCVTPLSGGVNAVTTSSAGLPGLTAMLGSLSWLVSSLSALGSRLTTEI